MADTGILFRRGLKVNLIADPPVVGEIVYAIDSGEHGWLSSTGSLEWGNLIDLSTIENGAVARMNTKVNLIGTVKPGEIVFATDTNEHGWINAAGTLIWKDMSVEPLQPAINTSVDTSSFNNNLASLSIDATVQDALNSLDDIFLGNVESTNVITDNTNFTNNLSGLVSNPTLQVVLDKVDDLVITGIDGTLITDNFNGLLSVQDDTIQKAFDTIDDITIPSMASEINVINGGQFNGNLINLSEEPDVQEALELIDDFILDTTIDASNFGHNLTTTADTVQKVADEVDLLELGEVNEDYSASVADFVNKLSGATNLNEIFTTIDSFDFIDVIDASSFTGNLETTDDTLQKVAEKFDDYVHIIDASNFTGNLETTDTHLQLIANKVDALVLGEVNEEYSTSFDGNLADLDGVATIDSVFQTIDDWNINVIIDATNFSGNLTTTDDTIQKVADKVDVLVLGEVNEEYSTSFDGKLIDLDGVATIDSVFQTIDDFNFADPLDSTTNTILPTTLTTLQDLNDAVDAQSGIDTSKYTGRYAGDDTINTLESLALSVDGLSFVDVIDASNYTGNLETTDDTLQKVADKVDALILGEVNEEYSTSFDGKLIALDGIATIDSVFQTIDDFNFIDVIDASNYTHNLATTDDTLQKVADKVDILPKAGSGATADRPTNPLIGDYYWDTDLAAPIWYNGTDWTDATGTVV